MREVIVIVLTRMNQHYELSAFFEFEIQRSLLDDIRFGGDHDDVYVAFSTSLNIFPEVFPDVNLFFCVVHSLNKNYFTEYKNFLKIIKK